MFAGAPLANVALQSARTFYGLADCRLCVVCVVGLCSRRACLRYSTHCRMKLTGQDQPLVTGIVEEPSSGEEDTEATDEDVESFEEIDGEADDSDDHDAECNDDEDKENEDEDDEEEEEEEIEEIIEEIIELSPCAQRVTALRHNPLIVSADYTMIGTVGNIKDS